MSPHLYQWAAQYDADSVSPDFFLVIHVNFYILLFLAEYISNWFTEYTS